MGTITKLDEIKKKLSKKKTKVYEDCVEAIQDAKENDGGIVVFAEMDGNGKNLCVVHNIDSLELTAFVASIMRKHPEVKFLLKAMEEAEKEGWSPFPTVDK